MSDDAMGTFLAFASAIISAFVVKSVWSATMSRRLEE